MQIRNNYSKNEKINIAKIIQNQYRYNIIDVYKDTYKDIEFAEFNNNIRIKLKNLINNALTSRNSFRDTTYIKKVLINKYNYTPNSEFYKRIECLCRVGIPGIKSIVDELNTLISEFGGFSFGDNLALNVKIGPFKIQEIDFGEFLAEVSLKKVGIFNYDHSLKAFAISPKYPINDNIHTHPHIRNNNICIGNGRSLISKALFENRLFDTYSIINSVLNTYSDDPFLKIEAWTGISCNDCGEYYTDKDASQCDQCGKIYCPDCVTQCCSSSDYLCYNCKSSSFKCFYCNKRMCCECVLICESCNSKYCNEHDKICC